VSRCGGVVRGRRGAALRARDGGDDVRGASAPRARGGVHAGDGVLRRRAHRQDRGALQGAGGHAPELFSRRQARLRQAQHAPQVRRVRRESALLRAEAPEPPLDERDPSALRERLAYDTYRAVGVEAPRSAWAEVVVDGSSRGLFSMVEQIDGRFTESRWPDDGDGDLYKEAWPASTDAEFYREHLENNEETADPAPLVDFAQRLAETPAEQRLEFLAERLDVDHWLRYLAVDDALANWDGATTFYVDKGGNNHNFFLYV